MIKQQFLGRNPTHFQFNPVVKAFIFSEIFVWSSWYLIIPILAVFITKVEGGTVELAGSAVSVYMIGRIILEIIVGRYLSSGKDYKFHAAIIGITAISISYLGLAFSMHLYGVFVFIFLTGASVGIITPATSALFSTHLDKDKEPYEWGLHDAIVFAGMALASSLGGFIAGQYGFRLLFLLAAVLNLIGIVPYLLYRSSMVEKAKS